MPLVRKTVKTATALTLAGMLAGCGPLISFGQDGPADSVYSLEYQGAYGSFDEGAPTIYFDEPIMAEGLGGRKLAVRLQDFRRSTVAGASWSSNLADLMRGYLVRSVANTTGAQLIGEGGLDVEVGCRIATHVWSFELVPGADASDDIVDSTMELTLLNLRTGDLLGKQTFAAKVGVAGSDSQAIARAFNRAIENTAGEISTWLSDLQDGCK
jgi:ABC-type uncharacterized transport system auxiliary subunit